MSIIGKITECHENLKICTDLVCWGLEALGPFCVLGGVNTNRHWCRKRGGGGGGGGGQDYLHDGSYPFTETTWLVIANCQLENIPGSRQKYSGGLTCSGVLDLTN